MKTLLTLYVDVEVKAIAKAKGINLSRAFQEFLSMEIELTKSRTKLTDKELVASLKQKNAILASELVIKSELLKKVLKKKKKDNGTKTVGTFRFPDQK